MRSDDCFFVYIKIPEDIQPLARGDKYEDPLQERLSAQELGEVTGGGSQLGDNTPEGSPTIEYCGIDVDVRDLSAGLELLRSALRELNAPVGTELQYTINDQMLQDMLQPQGWLEQQPRADVHPGFGV